MAMALYRTNTNKRINDGMKFIESLIKAKYSMCLTDSEDQTPLSYLLVDSVPEEAVYAVI